ncbi:LuxR C-terminal-related transcriptional regulator [Anatilimnocola floriformis]|uniref:LuxR C-terminal-related transcriptional regulator n=1 Tax=Anatilimnocola floriformis TaxID=2948575 RepID=UPI0020C40216|nr:LuxR C-terminal-related transcriptional regulator [Anatilimnocola floriformis]
MYFESFLAGLSATFVKVPAAEVDGQIELGLKQIVEFLDLDRSGFGEVTSQGMVITHSYQLPGIPPSPRVILEAQFPFYARKVQQGEVFRMPEDLPPEAAREWEMAARSGMKSNLTIPLKVTGSVVGGIGFASFRAQRDWPDALIQRLRLVGDIFTNALARKRAEEALAAANEQARILREELARQIVANQERELNQKGESERVQLLVNNLTPREREVFFLVAAGMPNKNIATRLDVSLQSVKLYRARVMEKLQLATVADLVRLADKAKTLLGDS